ncbi:APC family permease [Paraburkholderia acidicola]|uniref:APC family permease n=1 Tax=Paraburkholderia acidicola TaxID=1912599 RepID=A0ABV1LUB5_9BURK
MSLSSDNLREAGGVEGDSSLRGDLGASSILFMVMAAAAPLTVVGGAIPVGILLGNGEAFPAMFIVATITLLLFSVGLMAMSKHLPDAGAFFTYISHGIGTIPGVAAAYLAIVTYTTIQIAVFALFGSAISADLVVLGAPAVPWWFIVLLAIVVVGTLGNRHIELSSKVLVCVLVLEVGIVLALAAAIAIKGGAEGLSVGPFKLQNLLSGSPALGLMFAIVSFIGFESTVVYRSEVRDPNRTIPLATYGSALIIGAFYLIAAIAVIWGIGPSKLTEYISADPSTVLQRLTETYLGQTGAVIVSVLFLSSMFACVLSLHNVLARYQYSMAKAKLLPSPLGSAHKAHGSPHVASLVQVVSAAVITGLVAALQIPAASVFAWFAGIGTLAIVALMAATCLAVMVFFARNKLENSFVRTTIAPGLGLIGLSVSAWLITANFPLLVGDVNAKGQPMWGIVSDILVAVVVIGAIVGACQAVVLRIRNPSAYRNITKRLDRS